MRSAQGHMHKVGNNRYKIKLILGKGADGKPVQKWWTFRGGPKEADNYFSDLKRQYLTGYAVKPEKINLNEFMDRWLRDYCKVNLSERSYERYQALIDSKIKPALGHLALSAIRPAHIQAFYSQLLNSGLSARTVRYIHAVIHRAFISAIKWQLLNHSPADSLDIPKPRHVDMEVWNETQVSQFLAESKKTEYFPMFYLFLYSGCRRSEILGLRWNDVDFKQQQITIRRGLHQLRDNSFVYSDCKTEKSRRTISLPPSAVDVLFNHKAAKEYEAKQLGISVSADDLVFNQLGKPYRPNSITRVWSTIALRAKVKHIRLHDSRHSHVALMIKAGVDIGIISKRLGHSSIGVTMDIYGHLLKGVQENAVSKFDDMLNTGNIKADKAV